MLLGSSSAQITRDPGEQEEQGDWRAVGLVWNGEASLAKHPLPYRAVEQEFDGE